MLPQFYSQAGQDRFVYQLAVVGEGRIGGTFLDVGCSVPVSGNNTYALERSGGWRGLLVDCACELAEAIARNRSSPFLCGDAKTIDWASELAKHDLGPVIDYLSFDVDYDGLTALARLPLDRLRFRYATVEHDAYRFGDGPRTAMRELLSRAGYELLCPDVECLGRVFEDWWVDPRTVDMRFAEKYRTRGSTNFLDIVSR